MNYFDEELEYGKKVTKKNNKNLSKIILIAIIVVAILIVIIICVNIGLKGNTLKVTLNGTTNSKIKDMLIFEGEKVYIPIRQIAEELSYKSYNGDYTNKSEDKNKCYVESEQEVATFTLGSDKIYKITAKNDNYDYYYIDEPVKSMNNGTLYTTMDGIEKAFNVSFKYDVSKKKVTIQTMENKLETYKNSILDFGFSDVSSEFNDTKAILKSKAIVLNDKKKYGVFDIDTDERLLETKYDKIEYIPTTGDFLVQSNKKYGIVSSEGSTKVSISYDSIELMDRDKNMYLVKRDGKYGVIDINENVKISIDYDEIGMDISNFEKNEIKSKYILAQNLIPVRKDKLWGLFNLSGNQVTDFEYDSFGYKASSNKEAENLLVIPDYNVIVACKDKKYNLINSSGEKLWNGLLFDDVYMTVTSTEKKYYIIRNEKKYDAQRQLERIGLVSENKVEEKSPDQEENNNQSNNNGNKTSDDNQDSNEENSNNDEQNNNDENQNDNGQSDNDENSNDNEQSDNDESSNDNEQNNNGENQNDNEE